MEELLVTEPNPEEPGQHKVTGIRLGSEQLRTFLIFFVLPVELFFRLDCFGVRCQVPEKSAVQMFSFS